MIPISYTGQPAYMIIPILLSWILYLLIKRNEDSNQ
jgi:hypothetical protein